MVALYGIVFYRLTSSNTEYYSTVQSYINDNKQTYYDFYDIDSYLNDGEKCTLSEINSLKVYYNIDPKDNYNITLKKKDFEITYFMYKTDSSVEELQNCILIDDNNQIYLEKNEKFLSVKCFFDSHTLLSINVRDINNYEISTLQDILLKLMQESIELNHKKNT